jgi:hypothetical protein
VVSTLNWEAGILALANAAVVPLSAAGAITVLNDGTTVDIFVDVNRYYCTDQVSGTRLLISGSYAAGGMLKGSNHDLGGSSYGGFFETFGAALGATGAYGLAYGPGPVSGLHGETRSTTDGAIGVFGEASGTSGVTYGVRGSNASIVAGSAAVFGQSGTAAWTSPYAVNSGVRGASDGGTFSFGVLGEGTTRGVHGARLNSSGGTLTSGVLGYTGTSGVHSFNDITAIGVKSFVEPHPTDPGRQIVYIAMEGPEAGTYFRGRGRFDGKSAVIVVPESFRLVTEEEGLTVQITPIGPPTAVGVASMDLNQIVVEANRDVEFSYLVQGVRHRHGQFEPIQANSYFVPSGPDARMEPWPEAARGPRNLPSGRQGEHGHGRADGLGEDVARERSRGKGGA